MIRLACLMAILAGPAAAECRQALALGLDASGSVDAREYRLQLDGLAEALTSPEVRARLVETPEAPVRLAVYEWSGPESQRILLPWTEIADAAALGAVADRLRGASRAEAQLSTALGVALQTGVGLLASQQDCWRRTLDLSGDGPSNTGPRPQDLRGAVPPDVTVNGLVIGQIPQTGDDRAEDVRELSAYYEANVIAGADAFVELALGYDDYAEAMRRKLLRELASLVLGGLDDTAVPPVR